MLDTFLPHIAVVQPTSSLSDLSSTSLPLSPSSLHPSATALAKPSPPSNLEQLCFHVRFCILLFVSHTLPKELFSKYTTLLSTSHLREKKNAAVA